MVMQYLHPKFNLNCTMCIRHCEARFSGLKQSPQKSTVEFNPPLKKGARGL